MNTANNCPNGTDLTNNLESWGMDEAPGYLMTEGEYRQMREEAEDLDARISLPTDLRNARLDIVG